MPYQTVRGVGVGSSGVGSYGGSGGGSRGAVGGTMRLGGASAGGVSGGSRSTGGVGSGSTGAGAAAASRKAAIAARNSAVRASRTSQTPTSGGTRVQSQVQPYQPTGAAPGVAGTAGTMQSVGGGMMQPGSALYQDMLSRFKQDIGGQAAAQQRSAALTGAESGMGGGASPEAMQVEAAAGEAGTEAVGRAATDFGIAAPQAGAQIAAAGGGLSLEEQKRLAQEKQFGSSLAEGGRQFDVGSGFEASRIAQAQNQMNTDALMRMYGIAFGGF